MSEIQEVVAAKCAKFIEGLNDVFNERSFSVCFKFYNSIYSFWGEPRDSKERAFLACEIRRRVSDLLNDNIETMLGLVSQAWSDSEVLSFYTKNWDHYLFCCKAIKMIFSLLNRYELCNGSLKRNDEQMDITNSLYALAVSLWREKFLQRFNPRLSKSILSLIEMERDSGIVSFTEISNVLSSYELLSCDDTGLYCHETYEELFQKKFLEETEFYYRRKSDNVLENNSFIEYMDNVDLWLSHEKERSELYLDESSVEPLMQTCVRILIENHMERFFCEFQKILEEDSKEHFVQMFNLLSPHTPSLDRFCDYFKEYIIQTSTLAFEAQLETASTDFQVYIEIILQLYRRFDVRDSFARKESFVVSLNIAFAQLVNKNPVTVSSNQQVKSSEALARYCDRVLKMTHENENDFDFEDIANTLIAIFNHLHDKEVFMTFYKKMLTRRLIGQTSQSEDQESAIISRLKQTWGLETFKLQQMLDDIRVSRDLNERFRLSQTEGIDLPTFEFSVKALRADCWPYTTQNPFTIPKELEFCCEVFSDFYTNTYSTRKLKWLEHVSKGELVTNCFQNKYTIQVSTYQMAVLLQFNVSTTFTVAEIMAKTQIEMNIVIQVVRTLLKAKILVIESNCQSSSEDFYLDRNSRVTLFTSYRNKKHKININVPIKMEPNLEQQQVDRDVEESRKHVIKAAIVRIMKTQRTLDESNLIAEVTSQLSGRFSPNFAIIKGCIDFLLERDYIELDCTGKILTIV